jgi:hypothetical protein
MEKIVKDTYTPWQRDKIRRYFRSGVSLQKISDIMGVSLPLVEDALFSITTIVKDGALGSKREPYVETEDDYLKMGDCPLPNYLILNHEQ